MGYRQILLENHISDNSKQIIINYTLVTNLGYGLIYRRLEKFC